MTPGRPYLTDAAARPAFADRRVAVTGGLGFIGSGLVLALAHGGARVENWDLGTYAAHPDNLRDLPEGSHVRTRRLDIVDAPGIRKAWNAFEPELVFHLAAESHVDRSILDATPFVRTNVLGTMVLLDQARSAKTLERFVQVGTDEVYGDIPPDASPAKEDSPLRPSSPYSATKAAADLLALAYHRTHGLPIAVTRGSNTYGPRQFPEKLIPHMLMRARHRETLPLYGDGMQTRDWLYVDDHVRGILATHAGHGVYNLATGQETPNRDLVDQLLAALAQDQAGDLGALRALVTTVRDRPGHDRRYAIDATRARDELGWSPRVPLAEGLRRTVQWYASHPEWLERIRTGEHAAFLRNVYGPGG